MVCTGAYAEEWAAGWRLGGQLVCTGEAPIDCGDSDAVAGGEL